MLHPDIKAVLDGKKKWAVVCADFREVLPIPEVETVVTDPPYGIADLWKGGAGGKSSWRIPATETHAWDSQLVEGVEELASFKEAIIWGGNYYKLPPSRCWLVWDKLMKDNFTTGQCELAWTNLNKPVRCFRMCQAEAHTKMNKVHPTQKPLRLMLWCMKWVTGSAILDPMCGSGTTLVAAVQSGKRAIGIDISEEYCTHSRERLSRARESVELF